MFLIFLCEVSQLFYYFIKASLFNSRSVLWIFFNMRPYSSSCTDIYLFFVTKRCCFNRTILLSDYLVDHIYFLFQVIYHFKLDINPFFLRFNVLKAFTCLVYSLVRLMCSILYHQALLTSLFPWAIFLFLQVMFFLSNVSIIFIKYNWHYYDWFLCVIFFFQFL